MPAILLLLLLTLLRPVAAVSAEIVTTAPLVEDGILYAASYEESDRAGHLRAVLLNGSRQLRLWDAAERVPPPGAALPPAADPGAAALEPPFDGAAGERLIVTGLDSGRRLEALSFHARAAHRLGSRLGAAGVAEAAALINAVRGRLATSAADPGGSGDRPDLLGAISRSSPVLVGGSPFAGALAHRDRILYVGAEDGLLHAVLAGRWSAAGGAYDHACQSCGRELWGYLPGSLLPFLKSGWGAQAAFRSPLHVDGTPAVEEVFIDLDGDGRREWRTVLVGTASVPALNRGVIFALDVTDPAAPRPLWERPLAEIGLGPSRGAVIGRLPSGLGGRQSVFLTAATAGRVNGSQGLLACALDLADGALLWHFTTPCAGVAGDPAVPPTAPALMYAAPLGGVDAVLFGDPAGRLWALDPGSGASLGGGPVWQTPGAAGEPLGGGLTVRNRLVLLSSGGVESADPEGSYAVYAVEILLGGGRLLWNQALLPGERLWGAPAVDRFGRVFAGVGTSRESTGRVLVLAADGTLAGSVALAGSPSGGVVLAPGAMVTVSRAGQVEQFGALQQDRRADEAAVRVGVFSWRLR